MPNSGFMLLRRTCYCHHEYFDFLIISADVYQLYLDAQLESFALSRPGFWRIPRVEYVYFDGSIAKKTINCPKGNVSRGIIIFMCMGNYL